MLGFNHVSMSMTAGVLTLPWSQQTTTPGQLGWVVTVGGLGLLADLDKRGTTPARTWGPVTQGLARIVGTLAGGHRKGTHDMILAPLVLGGLTHLALRSPVGSCVVIALAIGLALQGLALAKVAVVGPLVNAIVSWYCAWWLVSHDLAARFDALPLAVAVALWAHMLGDALTHERLPVPVLWLAGNRTRVGLPLFTTGKRMELLVVTPIVQLLLVGVLLRHVGVVDAASARAEVDHLVRVAVVNAPRALPS